MAVIPHFIAFKRLKGEIGSLLLRVFGVKSQFRENSYRLKVFSATFLPTTFKRLMEGYISQLPRSLEYYLNARCKAKRTW